MMKQLQRDVLSCCSLDWRMQYKFHIGMLEYESMVLSLCLTVIVLPCSVFGVAMQYYLDGKALQL